MNVINNSNDGQFLKSKKWLALVTGIVVLYISIIFSAGGFGEGVQQKDKWIGYALAFAVCATEFMVASDYKKLNISMVVLGFAAYTYSIYTNVIGFYLFRGMNYVSLGGDYMNLAGGIFLDVFPEVAISFALNESKVGDFFGNLVKAWKSPETMTNGAGSQPNKLYQQSQTQQRNNSLNYSKPSSMEKGEDFGFDPFPPASRNEPKSGQFSKEELQARFGRREK